MEIVSS